MLSTFILMAFDATIMSAQISRAVAEQWSPQPSTKREASDRGRSMNDDSSVGIPRT